MRIVFLLCSLFISQHFLAQQRFTEDLFDVDAPQAEIYAVKDGEELKMDIYSPSKDTMQARPLIVFMHGGGFSGGSYRGEDEIRFARAAAKKGYVSVQISYRLTRKGKSFGCDFEADGKIETFRLAAEDLMDALKFIVKNQTEYKIDPSRVIVGGSSAGAEAVLNAVYNERLMFQDLSQYENIKFAGIFSLAGAILDTRYITKQNAVPGVFFHGTKDNLVPYETGPHHWCDREKPGYIILDGSRSIVERLRELDSSYLLYSFKGGRHEHSAMPFDHMEKIFLFFKQSFLDGIKQQIEILE